MTTISTTGGSPQAAVFLNGTGAPLQGAGAASPQAIPTIELPKQTTSVTPEKPLGNEAFKKMFDAVQQKLSAAAPSLDFSIDSGSGQTVIKVMDPATKDVIRQIPSEEVLKLNQEITSMQGMLLNKKA